MPIQPRAVKDPATAVSRWSRKIQAAGADWAAGYANPKRSPFDPNVINGSGWQAGVSTDQALQRYKRNLAGVNQDVVLATVNGSGKAKYVEAATTKTAKVSAFMANFLPKLGQVLQNLNATQPKGPRGTNRGRLNAYLDAVEAMRGSF